MNALKKILYLPLVIKIAILVVLKIALLVIT